MITAVRKTCCVEGCSNVVAMKGKGQYRTKCEKHRRNGRKQKASYKPVPCCVEGCCNNRIYRSRLGLCEEHRKLEIMRKATPCCVEGCKEARLPHNRRCEDHKAKWKEEQRKRSENWQEHLRASSNRLRNGGCWFCGWDKASCDVHRLIPGKYGGRYVPSNKIALCPNCHREVTQEPYSVFGKIVEAIRKGFLMSSHLLDIAPSIPRLWKIMISETLGADGSPCVGLPLDNGKQGEG